MRNVSGQWMAHQANDFHVRFDIRQSGNQLTGTANFGPDDEGNMTDSMDMQGTVTDTEFLLTVSWPNGSRGRYTGTFQLDDRLTGVTVDLQHPQSQASWFSDRSFPRS